MRSSKFLLGAAVALAAIPAYAADSAGFPAPVASSAPAGVAPQRAMIIPFNVLNVPESQQWIGQGVQETIVADLGRSGIFAPVPFEGQVIVEDNATAIRLAKAANAAYVIRGTAQVVGNNVRITGQLIDVKSGETAETAIATGTMMDILNLEDSISTQLLGVDNAPAGPPATAPVIAQPSVAPPQAPQIFIVPGGPTYYAPQPVYTPDIAYDTTPYYYYPYIYSYGVVLNRHDGDHNRDDDHDRDDDHGRGGDGHHHYDPNLGPNGDGSGVFHIITKPSRGATALPLPTSNVLPLPTNNVLPLPTTHMLPLPTNNVLPLPTHAGRSGSGVSTPVNLPSPQSHGDFHSAGDGGSRRSH